LNFSQFEREGCNFFLVLLLRIKYSGFGASLHCSEGQKIYLLFFTAASLYFFVQLPAFCSFSLLFLAFIFLWKLYRVSAFKLFACVIRKFKHPKIEMLGLYLNYLTN